MNEHDEDAPPAATVPAAPTRARAEPPSRSPPPPARPPRRASPGAGRPFPGEALAAAPTPPTPPAAPPTTPFLPLPRPGRRPATPATPGPCRAFRQRCPEPSRCPPGAPPGRRPTPADLPRTRRTPPRRTRPAIYAAPPPYPSQRRPPATAGRLRRLFSPTRSYPGSPTYGGPPEYPGYGAGGNWSGGWPPPPAGYGTWGPAPQPAWAPAPPTAAGRRSSLTILLVSVLIAALVGLLIGGQLVSRTTTATPPLNLFPSQSTAGGRGGVNSSGTGLPAAQAKAIANAIDPAVVDIDARLGYQQAAAAGTGMILTSDGEILTNNHVIDGATSLMATVVGGKTYNVKVLGTDPTDDVALLKLVGASGLTPIKTGDPTKLTVGQPIVAVGNAGGVGGTPSVATGTVTDLDQSVTASDLDGGDSEQLSGLIQINAPLEPGDSGGPLLTANGLVVGMDTAASTSGSDQSQTSIGFAIPITRALAIAQQIAAGHTSATIQLGLPGFLGVSVFESNPTATPGADIMQLLPGSPAGKAGLVAGDVITSIDGQAVTSSKNLTVVMQHRQPGEKVTVGYTDLSGASQSVSVTLSTGPAA